MASNLNISDVAGNAQATAFAKLCNSGYLRVYDGAQPFDADTPITSQRLLAELRFGDPAFHPPIAGALTARPMLKTSDAAGTGTATWFRCASKSGVAILDGTVGHNGDPVDEQYDINMDAPKIQQHAKVTIEAFSYQV